MMNVKPGDLAVIIKGGWAAAAANEGRIVEVVRAFPFIVEGAFSWYVKGRLVMPGGAEVGELGVKDCDLRPIRNPGDDAVDEMLRPLPAERDATLAPKPQREFAR